MEQIKLQPDHKKHTKPVQNADPAPKPAASEVSKTKITNQPPVVQPANPPKVVNNSNNTITNNKTALPAKPTNSQPKNNSLAKLQGNVSPAPISNSSPPTNNTKPQPQNPSLNQPNISPTANNKTIQPKNNFSLRVQKVPESPKVEPPLTDRVPRKNDLSTLNSIEYTKKNISSNLRQLLNEYNQLSNNEFIFSGNGRDPHKQEKIKEFLEELHQEKKQRRKKIRRLQQLQEQRRKNMEEHEQKFEKEAQKKAHKQEVEERLKLQLVELKQRQLERAREKQRWEQFYKKFKSEKPVFLAKLQQEKQIQKQTEKQIQDKLRSISKKYRPLDPKEIEEHNAQYEAAKEELQKKREYQKSLYSREIKKENHEYLHSLWKGKVHESVLKEGMARQQKQKEPALKLQRIKEYQKMIKEKLLPMTSRKKQDDDEDEDIGEAVAKSQTSRSNKRRRYKFVNGVSLGEVLEAAPQKRTQAEMRQLGNEYLARLRSLPKQPKKQKDEQEQTNIETPKKPPKQPIQRYIQEKNPLYDSSKRRHQSFQLPPDASKEEIDAIMLRLRSQDKKVLEDEKLLKHQHLPSVVDFHDRQKHINDRILDSIELKLNLLSKMGSR